MAETKVEAEATFSNYFVIGSAKINPPKKLEATDDLVLSIFLVSLFSLG